MGDTTWHIGEPRVHFGMTECLELYKEEEKKMKLNLRKANINTAVNI